MKRRTTGDIITYGSLASGLIERLRLIAAGHWQSLCYFMFLKQNQPVYSSFGITILHLSLEGPQSECHSSVCRRNHSNVNYLLSSLPGSTSSPLRCAPWCRASWFLCGLHWLGSSRHSSNYPWMGSYSTRQWSFSTSAFGMQDFHQQLCASFPASPYRLTGGISIAVHGGTSTSAAPKQYPPFGP